MQKIQDKPTAFGHLEMVCMRNVLNEFIPSDNNEIENPSYYTKSNNKFDHSIDILQEVVNHAHKYKQYLTSQNAIVKIESDKESCNYNLPRGADKCYNFVN